VRKTISSKIANHSDATEKNGSINNRRKINSARPWLSLSGVELPVETLKTLCRDWDARTWQLYLKWFESPRRESSICTEKFEYLSDAMEISVAEELHKSCSAEDKNLCELVFSRLPTVQRQVLELSYLEGRTDAEIAHVLGKSRNRISEIKNSAIRALKREFNGERPTLCPYMGDAESEPADKLPSVWQYRPPEASEMSKVIASNNSKNELLSGEIAPFERAIRELSPLAQKSFYRRFWLAWTQTAIARETDIGLNVVQSIECATVSRIKNRVIEIEIQNEKEN
jgi:RNA polymerase sigma factor (sigma-70 family)